MRTRQRHYAHESTVLAVCNAKTGSWSNTAKMLGFEDYMGATLSDVARGKPSAVTPEGENLIRKALGLLPLNRVLVDACPTCGGDHGLKGIPDCGGLPVASVVTLAPGEVVANAADVVKRTQDVVKRERKPRATVQMEPETRELLRSDKRPGESFDDVIRRWHDSDPYR